MTTVWACIILIGIAAFALFVAWADQDLRRQGPR